MKNNYNIQIIHFKDGTYYVTARTDVRSKSQIEACEKHGEWYAQKGMSVAPVLEKLQTHKIHEPINPEGLQGLSKDDAISKKIGIIRALRSLGNQVINTTK